MLIILMMRIFSVEGFCDTKAQEKGIHPVKGLQKIEQVKEVLHVGTTTACRPSQPSSHCSRCFNASSTPIGLNGCCSFGPTSRNQGLTEFQLGWKSSSSVTRPSKWARTSAHDGQGSPEQHQHGPHRSWHGPHLRTDPRSCSKNSNTTIRSTPSHWIVTLLFHIVFFQFPPESRTIDFKQFGCCGDISIRLF
mgnify:CR=1 FL=1